METEEDKGNNEFIPMDVEQEVEEKSQNKDNGQPIPHESCALDELYKIPTKFSNVVSLKVDQPRNFKDKHMIGYFKTLTIEATQLRNLSLEISRCNLPNKGIAKMYTALGLLSNLNSLSINCSKKKLTKGEARALLNALEQLKSLKNLTLNLSKTQIKEESLELVSEMLCKST